MEDITKTITDKSLEDLGVIEAPKPAPEADSLDIPEFLDRRKTKIADVRHKSWQPKSERGSSPESWQKDDVLKKLDELRQTAFTCMQGEADTHIDSAQLHQIAGIVATDIANGLNQAGLVYMDSGSPEKLKGLIKTFIQAEMKHSNGSMYRYLKVVDNG